jgi:predicted phosphate transport protein (TIGR00153 family)
LNAAARQLLKAALSMLKFAPHKEKFFDLFKQAAENALSGARALKQMLEHYDNPQESWKKIKDLEHEGDRITHRTIRSLNQTFLTPIDAEDIHALITALDNVMDAIEAAAARMILFRIDQPTTEAKELSEIIVTSAEQLVKAVSHMPRLDDIDEYCIEINRLENTADDIYRKAISRLFENGENGTAPLEVIKWLDIYEILESATDRCEDVANTLETVGLKNS